jgi:zinc protease
MVQPHRKTSLRAGVAVVGLSLTVCAQAHGFPDLLPHPAKRPAPAATGAPAPAPGPNVASDAGVRTGVLANGLRYAIARTTNLPGKVSFRLRVAVGSLSEADDERGFSQLLARAPFDGVKPAPDGALSDLARAHGLSFTADGNADVAAQATTFSLDLTANDSATLAAAVALMRGSVGEPKLAQGDVDNEWNTVVAHEHAANDLANRLFRARLAFLLEGQRPAVAVGALGDALPKKVKRGPIAAFHHRFYRPELTVLAVAGDVDVAAMEQSIRATFGAWRGLGAPGEPPSPGPIEQRGPQTRLLVEPGAPTSLQLSWVSEPDVTPDSSDRRGRDAVQRLALAVVNRRLAALADSAEPPFESAAAFQDTQFGAARVTGLLINAEPDRWRDALAGADQAERAAVSLGVNADELAGARAAVEADLTDAAANADTRPPAFIADTLAAALVAREAASTPAEDLAQFDLATANTTPDQIDAVLKDTFRGQGPLLFMSSPTQVQGGEAAVAAAFAGVEAQPVKPPVAPAPNPQAYRDFGEAGKIADRKDIIDLDTVFLRFENGVRLTLKSTKFKDGEVGVKVRVGGGLAALPGGRTPPSWALRTLVDGAPAAAITAEDDALALTGAAGRDDLETLLRTLATPIVAPAWRGEAFARAQAAQSSEIELQDRSAAAVLARALPGLAHGGDPRWAAPNVSAVRAATLGEARAPFEAMLANGPIEVIVVGDITEQKAIDAVAATFGALPARSPPPAAPAAVADTPASVSTIVLGDNGGDGRAATLWPTEDASGDPRQARLAQLLAETLRGRLADTEVGPQGVGESSLAAPHSGLIGVILPGPAGQLDTLLAHEASVAADLRARDVGADELTRAKNELERSEERARETNAHWLDLLSGAQDDPRRLTAIRAFSASIERVTPDELHAAAQRYLGADAAMKIEVRPAGS